MIKVKLGHDGEEHLVDADEFEIRGDGMLYMMKKEGDDMRDVAAFKIKSFIHCKYVNGNGKDEY